MMKKNLLLLFWVIFISCSQSKFIEKSIPGETVLHYLDFQPYIEKGFVFSTGDINQNYIPLGVVYYTVKPDIVKIYKETVNPVTESMIENDQGMIEGGEAYLYNRTVRRQANSMDDVLKKAYEYAKSQNANGITYLKYDINTNDEIVMSGQLVKIED